MIAAFTRFDLANLLSSPARVLAPLLIVVLAALSPLAILAVPAGAVVVSLIAATPFLGDERGRLDVLYATAPLSRAAVVVGRYLTLLVGYVLIEALATTLVALSEVIRARGVDGSALGGMHEASVLVVAIVLAVQLPCFFALGYTRGRAMIYVPIAVIAAATWAAGQTGLLDDASPLSNLSPTLGLAAIPLAIILLFVSALISVRLYRRRSL